MKQDGENREMKERLEKKEHVEKVLHSKKDMAGMKQPDRTEGAVVNLMRLNELMVQTLKLQAAPKVEIDTFLGDPLEYGYFIENFKGKKSN